jgi:(S)-2-hydroxyglutarate dehydrogenase
VTDFAVIGAGLVGLATAHRLQEQGASVVVLEKEARPGMHQSGHNSGVVHAGLYYEPGSLKARLCREGAAALREKCAEWGVPVVTRGKLVVAVREDELAALGELERRGRANGIVGLELLDEWREIEPNVRGIRALHVPETAVVDYRHVAQRLAQGLDIRYGVDFRGEAPADRIVACAGLQADRVAALVGLEPSVRIVPFRGDYWRLRGAAAELVRGLVYPVPDPAFPFLGVHFTRGVDGAVTAGPNAVPALARERYGRLAFSPRDAAAAIAWPGFVRLARRYARTGAREIWRDAVKPAALAEMRRYLPDLAFRDVARGGCGIRAQAMRRDGTLVDDFLVEEGPRSLHVLNAPSPAATSCLAIGSLVAERALA